ncbi:MAG TPA: hypothetical protein VN616_05000 [Puia sp.]|nr:hypothetical protein [Puia sp.]
MVRETLRWAGKGVTIWLDPCLRELAGVSSRQIPAVPEWRGA